MLGPGKLFQGINQKSSGEQKWNHIGIVKFQQWYDIIQKNHNSCKY